MAKQLNVSLQFTADTAQARAQLKQLQQALTELGQVKSYDYTGKLKENLFEGAQAANQLKASLDLATNAKTGKLDLTKFKQQLDQSGMTLQEYQKRLSQLGPDGTRAFAQLAQSIQQAEMPLFRVNNLFANLWTTMKNTARWQFTSGALHKFIGEIQTAYHYAQDLNESLNNIRIVTGQSVDQMAKFAEQANKAAKRLSTTTTDYTDAALIYYQQGLSDEEVLARTDVTIKMANVAGESAEKVSDQLTAVWNNFYDGSKSLEYYADVMTALGAATASSTDEISQGLNKFAAVAETVGLSYEYAAAALATVTATTRQSADIVGTAFRTLFARLEGLQLGETLDDGTDLNKYSKALATVGVNIKDTSGQLKDMDQILDELGAKWGTLAKDQQVALAQTVAGVRQYTQLIALMDNWDFFQENIGVVAGAEGTLQEQADIYAESWEAARDRVKAAAESIYSDVIDDKFFIKLTNFFGDILGLIDNVIDSIGGLPGLLTGILSLVMKIASPNIANSIKETVFNIKRLVNGRETEQGLKNESNSLIFNMRDQAENAEAKALSQGYIDMATYKQALIKNSEQLSELDRQQGQIIAENIRKQAEFNAEEAKTLDLKRQEIEEEFNSNKSEFDFSLEQLGEKDTNEKINSIRELSSSVNEYIEKIQEKLQIENRSKEDQQELENSTKVLNENYKALTNSIEVYLDENKDLDSATKTKLKTMLGEIKALKSSTDQMASNSKAIDRNKTNIKGLSSEVKKYVESLKEVAKPQKDWSNYLTDSLGGLSSLAFGITSVSSAFKQLSDPDTSSWEKFLSLITAMSFGFPQIVSGITKFGQSFYNLGLSLKLINEPLTSSNKLLQLNHDQYTKLGIALSNYNKAKTEEEKQLIKEQVARMLNISTEEAEIILTSKQEGETWKQCIARLANTGAIKAETAAKIKNIAVMSAYLAIAALVVIAIIALVKAIKNYKTEDEKLNEQIANSKEQLKQMSEAAKNSAQEIDKLKSSWNSLNNAQDTLKNLVKGTIEWKEQIAKINGQVLELITEFPKLANYISNVDGVLTISEEGYNKVLENQIKKYEQLLKGQSALTLNTRELEKQRDYKTETKRQIVELDNLDIDWGKSIDWHRIFAPYSAASGYEQLTPIATVLNKNGLTTNDLLNDNYKNRIANEEDLKQIEDNINQIRGIILEGFGDIEPTRDRTAQDVINTLISAGVKSDDLLKENIDNLKDKLGENNPLIQYLQSNHEAVYSALLSIEQKIPQLSSEDIKTSIFTANENWLHGEDSNLVLSGYEKYSDAIAEMLVVGYERAGHEIDSFEKRREEALKKLESEQYTGNGHIGRDKEFDRIRNLYAEAVYGEGATYQYDKDNGGRFVDSEGNEITKIDWKTWSDENAKMVIANLRAAEIEEKYQTETIDIIKDINNAISKLPIELAESEKEGIINSTLQSGGQYTDYSSLGFNRIQELANSMVENGILSGENEQSIQESYTKLMQANLEASEQWAKQTAAREASELNKILSEADMTPEGFDQYVDMLEEAHQGMGLVKEDFEAMAKAGIKTANGITALNKVVSDNENNLDKANKGSAAYAKGLGDIQSALNDWLDVEFDAKTVREFWEDGTITNAIEGDIESIKKLSIAAAELQFEDIELNVNQELFREQLDQIKSLMDEVANEDIQINATIDNTQAVDALNELIRQGQITAEQASKYLSSIGYHPTMKTEKHTERHEWRMKIGSLPEISGSFEQDIEIPVIDGDATRYVGHKPIATPASTKASKSSNKTGSSKERSPKENKALEDELDRYHYIREVLEDIENELDAVGKAKDRAFGAAKLKNMNKEIALYHKQIAAQKEYLKEIQEYYKTDKSAIAGYGAIFDEAGRISNYQSLMKAYVDQYNEGVKKYNTGSIDENQFKAYEDQWTNFQKVLSQYEETNNLLEEQSMKLTDLINAEADARLEKLKYNVELHLDIDDDELKTLDYMLNRLEDDAFKAAERIELLGEKTRITMDKVNVLGEGLKAVLSNKGFSDDEITSVLGGDFSPIEGKEDLFTEADIETLREYRDALIENAEALQEIRKEVNEQVIQAFDAWMEKINDTAKAFDHLASITQHYKNIVGLVGKATLGFSNEMMKSLNNTFIQNAINKLEASRKTLESLQKQSAEAQKALDEARARGIEADIKAWEETVQHINEQMNEVEEDMLSNWEDALQKIGEVFQENVEMTLETAGQAANGFASFDIMEDQYGKTKEERKRYLDDYAKMVELNSLQREISKDIDSTDNIKSQEALRELQEEINALQESGVQMSQYDLDYLKKRYELKKAELAIEEAQNTMSTVRLRRDNEGNWGYIYTADESKVDEAKDNYEKKMLEMRDMTNNYLDDLGEKIIQARRSMAEEIANIDRTIFDSDEAYMAEVERITSYYQGQIDYYLGEMQKGLENNDGLLQLSAEYYATNYADPMMEKNLEFQRSFNETILGTVSGGVSSTAEYGDAMKTAFEQMIDELNKNYQTMASQTEEAMQAAGTTTSEYADLVSEKIEDIADQSNNTKDTVSTMADQMEEDIDKKVIPAVTRWQEEWSPRVEDIASKVEKVTKNIGDLIKKIAELKPINIKVNYPEEWPIKVPEPEPNPIIARVITEYSSTGNPGGSGGGTYSPPVSNSPPASNNTWSVVLYFNDRSPQTIITGTESDCRAVYDQYAGTSRAYLGTNITKMVLYRGATEQSTHTWSGDDKKSVGGGCFEKGTEILMADNTFKFIENVEVGDMVMAYNEATGNYNPKPVLHSFAHHNTIEIIDVYLSNGIRIGMTACHPILTTDGWKSLNHDIALKEHEIETEPLQVGQEVIGLINAIVEKIEWREDKPNYDTYNITVEDDHTYIANGYVVHNMPAQNSSMKLKTGGYTGTWPGRQIISDQHDIMSGKTGMYTGNWGDSGRLAILHQKELVLNANDTENFLNGIGILREITRTIDLSPKNPLLNIKGFRYFNDVLPRNEELQQNVTIHADFPNATNHNEIEEAFKNIIGLASQYAGRRK